MLHRNGKEIEQIFRNGREIALLYKNGVIIYDKRRKSSPDITITYKSRNLSGDQVFTTESGEPGTLTITSSVPTWNNHALVGWSTNEWDYDNYLSAGDPITSDSDLTLYAVWNVTFQGLIDENYVSIGRTQPNGTDRTAPDTSWVGHAVGLTVSSDCPYPLARVSDFNEVFDSTKKVSFAGVVGEGEIPNAFLWPVDHWLTDDEVYNLYNNVTLQHDVIGMQFKYLDWSDKPSVTIKYAPAGDGASVQGWRFTNAGIFGPNMPETINFDVANRNFSSSHWMFGRHNWGTSDNSYTMMSNTKTFNWITTAYNGYNRTTRDSSGMFEGATKLTSVTGFSLSETWNTSDMFHGCSSLTTIPDSMAAANPPYYSTSGMNQLQYMNSMYVGCSSLVSIVPVMNVTSVYANVGVFAGCSALTTMYLKSINASQNQDWDLSDTILNQASADYIVTNVYENVDTSADGFVYKNIYFPATVTITQEQASRLYQYGWNCYVNGEKINPFQFRVTFVNGETSSDIQGSLPEEVTVTGTKYTLPSSGLTWDEHNVIGYSETQYPTDIENDVYAEGQEITVDHDMTLYPVWNTTFQGLINEGYAATVANNGYFDTNIQLLRVSANHYPKELVTDFDEVFLSDSNKRVSANGVVGDGSNPNVFMHDSTNGWLTSDEWYTLYNNVELPYWAQNNQFSRMDWSNKAAVTLKFRGTGVPFNNNGGTQNTFFYRVSAPESITIDLGTSTCANLNVAFRHNGVAGGAHVKTITLVGENGGPVKVTGNMTGAFENCGTLTTVNGLDISSAYKLDQAFQSCGFTTIPASISSTGETSSTNIANMFKGCTSLQSIGVIINVTNVTNNDGVFAGDSALTTFYLKGINAQKNEDWDLSGTAINQNSVDYIVTNLTEWPTFNPNTDSYKNITFPDNTTLTTAQINRLNINGWKVFAGNNELTPAQ